MAFDVFEKLSELETEIHILRKDLEKKDAYIEELLIKNTDLERQLLDVRNQRHVNQLNDGAPLDGNNCGTSISDMLRETSEAVMRKTGYTYDDRTGLYYDHGSGYYYDPENQLFYEPKSRMYYKYNSETGEYVYHSKTDEAALYAKFKELTSQPVYQHMLKKAQEYVDLDADLERRPYRERSVIGGSPRRHSRRSGRKSRSHERRRRSSSSYHRKKRHKRKSHKHHRSSPSSSDKSPHRKKKREKSNRHRNDGSYSGFDDSCGNQSPRRIDSQITNPTTSLSANPVIYPPCVRLMVLASNHISAGQLFIITSQESLSGWGCIGRSSALCPSVNFPSDPEVDEIHSEILYNASTNRYSIADRSALSGTFVNGIAIRKKHKTPLCHGDIVRVGSSRLLVHIHDSHDSCGQCDSDEVKAALEAIPELETNQWIESIEQTNQIDSTDDKMSLELSSSERELRDAERQAKFQELKEKYGLKFSSADSSQNSNEQYVDRAAQRRAIEKNLRSAGYPIPPAFGQAKPRIEHPKLISRSSIYEPISNENKGAQLLTKMGWTPGFGLGKNLTGIAEPIVVGQRSNPQAGLGSVTSVPVPIEKTGGQLSHAQRIAKTRERFDKLA